MKIEIEIGKNLAGVMEDMIDKAHLTGGSPATELKDAFNLDLTAVITHLGCHKQAMDKGLDVTIETKTEPLWPTWNGR